MTAAAEIVEVTASEQIEQVRSLFREYQSGFPSNIAFLIESGLTCPENTWRLRVHSCWLRLRVDWWAVLVCVHFHFLERAR